MRTRGNKIGFAVNVIIQFILIFCTFLPFYFMIVSSFKNNAEISANYFGITAPIRFDNYVRAFDRVIQYLLNSVLICGVSVIGVTVLSCLSAYVFAKFEFPGKKVLFMVILAFMMIPSVLTMTPQFVLMVKLNLVGSRMAAILPYIAFGQIMFIYILRSFIEGIPKELFDAVEIDGGNNYHVFRNVVLPLSKPIIISLALMNFLNNWNDFIWPLLVLKGEKMKTITVGLYAFCDAQQIEYGVLFAGFVIASVPLVTLFSLNMKQFISGMTSGAIKA